MSAMQVSTDIRGEGESSLATESRLFASLQNQVERRLRRSPELLESGFGKHFAQAHFTGLRTKAQADFLG
jgi:hypothetical protein